MHNNLFTKASSFSKKLNQSSSILFDFDPDVRVRFLSLAVMLYWLSQCTSTSRNVWSNVDPWYESYVPMFSLMDISDISFCVMTMATAWLPSLPPVLVGWGEDLVFNQSVLHSCSNPLVSVQSWREHLRQYVKSYLFLFQ